MNIRESLFPDYHAVGRSERVERAWDTSWALPVPRGRMRPCPSCGGPQTIKDWRFHQNTPSPIPWRCDVRTKCMNCSLVLTYGVIVPEQMFRQARRRSITRAPLIHWRDGKELLRASGYFEED